MVRGISGGKTVLTFITVFIVGCIAKGVLAQTSSSVLYVPLIGITSVPQPLVLPEGAGDVTYHYAVKSFVREVALNNVQVVDDSCNSVKFVEGDDNGDSKLDYSETWRYVCTTTISTTTASTAVAIGTANGITVTHKAYATVVVGSSVPPPLISIVNITKVAYPLSLPAEGGSITFTYKVNNPGVAPLRDVVVLDDKCSAMSGKLGDTNGNDLLDTNEVWTYTCTTSLTHTTTNTVTVTAFANNFKAVGSATIIVKVDTDAASSSPGFPDFGRDLYADARFTNSIIWIILGVILVALIVFYVVTRDNTAHRKRTK